MNSFDVSTGELSFFEPPVLPLEEARQRVFEAIATKRREVTKQLRFAGMEIYLDTKTEDAIHKGIKGLERCPPGTTIMFEITPGHFAEMDLIWMQALGDAGFDLVQRCFKYASDLCDQAWLVDRVENFAAIDTDAGWPG